jgi:transcriptional antiterminator RfaH
MINWFVVQTHSRQEARAAVELARQDFQTYLPILDSKPMFPRYLFVRFNRETDNWGVIRSTRGCIDLLKDGFMPAKVPDKAMDAIMAYRPPQEPTQTQTEFAKGDPVRIEGGVLDGMGGLFQQDMKGRTQALLEIMGRKVVVPRETVRAA